MTEACGAVLKNEFLWGIPEVQWRHGGSRARHAPDRREAMGCPRQPSGREERTIRAAWIRRFCEGQLVGRTGQVSDSTYAPRSRFASCRTSSLSILYFNVLNGIPGTLQSPVTFQPHFSSARKMKFRSKVFVAILEQAVGAGPERLELREVKLERQVLFGDVFLVADRHQPLDQVLELADVARPPVCSSAPSSSTR